MVETARVFSSRVDLFRHFDVSHVVYVDSKHSLISEWIHVACRVLARAQGDSKHSLRVVSRERIPLNMTAKMVDNPNYPASLFQDDPTNDNTNRTGESSL